MANDKGKNPVLLKCRVLPNNQYGYAKAGSIVEVEPKDYALAKHCLISLEDEKRQHEAVAAIPSKTEQARTEFEGYRQMFRLQHETLKKNELDRLAKQKQEIEEQTKLLKE